MVEIRGYQAPTTVRVLPPKLVANIQIYGGQNREVNQRQVRNFIQRYINALDPNINHKEWTSEEDQIVIYIYFFYFLDFATIFNRWVQVECDR